jgi:hypothetical protein
MHVRREDMHICVSSLVKYKMHLHNSVGEHLHYAIIKFKMQIYICIALLMHLHLHDSVREYLHYAAVEFKI